MLPLLILVPAYQHRDMRVMDDVVANAAQERAPQFAHPPGSRDDDAGPFLLGYAADDFTWIPANALHLTTDLQ